MSPTPASSHGEQFAEVVVVRHGETAWNAARTIQGQMDTELNETGRHQAVMVARRLSKEAKPAAVYSSDLKRAAETAQTIAAACDVSNLVLDRALRERHMGDLHGLKWDDAVRAHPEACKALSSDERNQEIPGGGESRDQLSERCVSYLNSIAEKHKGERVIVVSHGATMEEICRHADPSSSVQRRIPNTSVSVVHISGSNGHWILEKATSTTMAFCRMHLAATGPLPNSLRRRTCGFCSPVGRYDNIDTETCTIALQLIIVCHLGV